MSGKYALIIGNTEYIDPGLAQLTAPGKDADDFARVLKDREICAFDDVKVLLNQPEHIVRKTIDDFLDQKKSDDLLILYFSGHGVRDELGTLYLAVKNTLRNRLRSTAIKSDYIREVMDQSRSKRQVLILDCCNSGAFAQGTKSAIGMSVGTATAFESGYGRITLTASDATQFAWEGDKVIGETDNSLFTHFLVEGLEGDADADGDGCITVDELYDYAYDKVIAATPKQTPSKFSSKQQGEIVLRQNISVEDAKPVPLPADLTTAMKNSLPYVREGAVRQLEQLQKGGNRGLAFSAQRALERIAQEDDSLHVRQIARQALIPVPAQKDQVPQQKPKPKDESKIAEKTIQGQSTTRITPLIIGITTILLLCLGGSLAVWRIIFPSTVTSTHAPVPPFFPDDGTSSPATDSTAIITATLHIDTTSTFTPAPTPTHTATITSLAPISPDTYLIFYFNTVIQEKNFIKGWSLLTPSYQAEKAKGWDNYVKFWSTVENWSYSTIQVEYNNSQRALVLITSTLDYYDKKTAPSLLDGVRYCLLWNEGIRTWQIDIRENCP